MKKTILMGLMLGAISASVMAVLESSTIAISFASSGEDSRSDRACDKMLDLEGKQDAKTEPDTTTHASDRGIQQANEGAEKALGDCPT